MARRRTLGMERPASADSPAPIAKLKSSPATGVSGHRHQQERKTRMMALAFKGYVDNMARQVALAKG